MAATSRRPYWSGTISFGLVSIPIRLYTAVREKNVSFRLLHDQDHSPIRYKRVCAADGKEVHSEHIVKGYEVAKDEYVILTQRELEAAAPKKTKAIEIEDFVPLGDIDPVYYDKTYHVEPQPAGAKAYNVLVGVMERSEKAGIARVVMHNKEHLVALRPLDGKLVMETLHFDDEVVSTSEVDVPGAKAGERELKMAEQLVNSLAAEWNPEKYRDEYREAIQKIAEKKAEGGKIVNLSDEEAPSKASAATSVARLSEMLEQSIAAARRSHGANGRHARSRPVTTERKRRKSA